MLIMVVATTATTVASHDRWKLPTPEWKAPTHRPQSRRDGRRRRTRTGGSITDRWFDRSDLRRWTFREFRTFLRLSFESPQWTTVEDDFGETRKPEQMRIRNHNNDTCLTTDLLDWYHQSTKVTMNLDLSWLLFSIFSYRETFYFTPELNPSLLSRGWLMFDSMHN